MIFEAPKSVFCKAILYKYIDKTHFNYKIKKNRSSFFIFFLKGGKVRKEYGGKKMLR